MIQAKFHVDAHICTVPFPTLYVVASLSYHYSLSDVESHKGPAFTYACLAAESLLASQEFDVILPYMEAALKSVSTGRQRWRLYRLLGRTMNAVSHRRSLDKTSLPMTVLLGRVHESLRQMKKVLLNSFISAILPCCFTAESIVDINDSPTKKHSSKIHCFS